MPTATPTIVAVWELEEEDPDGVAEGDGEEEELPVAASTGDVVCDVEVLPANEDDVVVVEDIVEVADDAELVDATFAAANIVPNPGV
jgi:hypothetical protein